MRRYADAFPNFVSAVRPPQADEQTNDFGLLKFKQVRELLVERGWARRTINI
jgi:hypothetical protein